MNVKKKYVGAGALAVGAVLAFALPAGAAVNLQSESSGGSAIKIAKNAQLKANGAATVITLNVTCPAGNSYYANVEVAQTIKKTTTQGTAYINSGTCTGYTEKVKVPVIANGAPFQAGVAYATAHVDVNGSNYVSLTTGREILNIA